MNVRVDTKTLKGELDSCNYFSYPHIQYDKIIKMSILVIASFYFLIAYLLIKREVRIYQIVSSLLYAISLQMIQWNITAFIVYLIIPISIAFFMHD